jgi:hypothetical protein
MDNSSLKMCNQHKNHYQYPAAESVVLDTENSISPSVVQNVEVLRRLDVASTNIPNVVVKLDGSKPFIIIFG